MVVSRSCVFIIRVVCRRVWSVGEVWGRILSCGVLGGLFGVRKYFLKYLDFWGFGLM